MNNEKLKESNPVRKPYVRPNIVNYGDIAQLTLSHAASSLSDSGTNLMAPSA